MLKTDLLDKRALSDISVVKTDLYLENQGWKKTGEIENYASTWLLEEEEIELLLPLNKNYSDFESRMLEVILILEELEERPRYEIFDVLKNTSKIASLQKREIIEIVIKSTFEKKHEVNAENFGQVLRSAQKYILALGNLSGLGRKLREEEIIKKTELELSLISSFHGSFGIRLGFGTKQQLNLNNSSISKEVSELFMDLLQIGGEENISKFRKKISSIKKGTLKAFKPFIENLRTLESNIVFDWGSVGVEEEKIIQVPYSKILEMEDALSKEEERDLELIELEGKFIEVGVGHTKDQRHFIFEDDEGEIFKGYISADAIEELREENKNLEIINGKYKILIERKQKINRTTGAEKISLKIINIERI